MAKHSGIAVVSRALVGLLEDACPRDRFPRAQFRLFQAIDLDGRRETFTEGLSVYLFRVAPSLARRNLPPRTDPTGRRFRPSAPVDLHYLITAWAADAEQQQRLLGWAIRTLEDTLILPPGFLNRFALAGEDVFGLTENVELVGEPLSLQDAVNIWEVAKLRQQPSVLYIARQVGLDSEAELRDAARVQTRVLAAGVPSPGGAVENPGPRS